MTPAPHRVRVLILARDQVIAALLALLVESERFEPLFALPDESPEDALARLRPPIIVMLDGALDAARSDLFFARAARARARVVLLAPPRGARGGGGPTADQIEAVARAHRVPSLPLTAGHDEVVRRLEELAEGLS